MNNKKRLPDEDSPKTIKLLIPKTSVPRYSPLRKKREEALLFILENTDNKIVRLTRELVGGLREFGWDWRAINTAANDTVRSGKARLEHDRYPGMFRLVSIGDSDGPSERSTPQ